MRLASVRRSNSTRRPHTKHTRPMSAPRRTIFQSVPPQGWLLRSLTMSSSLSSGSMVAFARIIAFGLRVFLPCYNARMIFDLSPAQLIVRIVVLAVAFTVHEFAHAFVADRFGDETPRRQGRLSLNPLVHLDPLGSLLLLVAGFGWARPVEINPYALQRRSPAAPMLVALAGPLSNLLLAVVAAIPVRVGLVRIAFGDGMLPTAYEFLGNFVIINVVLMFFNLLPIFPLDGEKVLHYFLPPSGKAALEGLRPYGFMILMLVAILLPYAGINILTDYIFRPAVQLGNFLLGT